MINYDEYFENSKQIAQLVEKVNANKKEINRQIREEYKVWFKVGNIILILMILFNTGALLITNALVVKEKPELNFTEANPIAAQVHNLASTNEVEGNNKGFIAITGIIIHVLAWVLMIGGYLYLKYRTYNRKQLIHNFLTFIFIAVFLTYDFLYK